MTEHVIWSRLPGESGVHEIVYWTNHYPWRWWDLWVAILSFS